jgi:protein-S-isoprenylcysteine O-methyltransferase Ste14
VLTHRRENSGEADGADRWLFPKCIRVAGLLAIPMRRADTSHAPGSRGHDHRADHAAKMEAVLWLRSAFFTLLLPGTVLIWVPLWLSTGGGTLEIGAIRWAGLPPLIIGAAGLGWCIWDFGRRGKGTLAPVDPPRFVVRSGLYQFVRNPMYLSVLIALMGEAFLFGSLRLVALGAFVAIAVHLFVVAYEEPTLRRQFGAEYAAYCSAVPRWRPRAPSA